MCGIVGYVGESQAAPILLEGLSKLEYRGYDSAGMAVYDGEKIHVKKATGRLKVLSELTHDGTMLPGHVGIGHTRWATHGEPSDVNEHPHCNTDQTIAVVHNGIIENYLKLKNMLLEKGYRFISETDTEVLAQLLDYYYKGNPLEAITKVMHRVEGSYALGIIFSDYPDTVYSVRKDSPLIVGKGTDGNLIASDVPAVLKYTREVFFIQNEEIACLKKDAIEFYNVDGEPIQKESKMIEWDVNAAEKGGYEHFMLKEMYEQPKTVVLIPFFKSSPTSAIPIAPVAPVIYAFFIARPLFVILLYLTRYIELYGGISILRSNSSLGRNGARSSSGADTSVPSSSLFVADFGSNFCPLLTNTSHIAGPFIASTSSITLKLLLFLTALYS